MSGSAVRSYKVVTNGKVYRIQDAFKRVFVMGPTVWVDAIFASVPTQKPLEFLTKEEAQAWVDKNTWRVV